MCMFYNPKARLDGHWRQILTLAMKRFKIESEPDERPTISYKHRASLGNILYEQYEGQSELCDVTLIIHGKEQKSHWCVLMVSPYFEALYQSGLSERQSGLLTLDFEDEASVRTIIKFMYTGEVLIIMDTIEPLLRTADYFLLPCFKQSCESFFQSYRSPTIDETNCVTLCLIGGEFDLQYVYQKAFNYIIQHFRKIVEGEQLSSLSDDTVKMLLKSPHLKQVSENIMFKFLLSWTNKDLLKRQRFFADLFSLLELEKFTKKEFNKMTWCALVACNKTCQDLIADFEKNIDLGLCRYHSRNSKQKDVFVFLGGNLGEPSYISMGTTLSYIVEDKKWCLNTCMGHKWELKYSLKRPLVVSLPSGAVFMMDRRYITSSGSLTFYMFREEEGTAEEVWSWTTGSLTCPKSNDFYVRALVNCGMIVYAVCCVETEWKLYQISLEMKKSCAGKLTHKSKLFTCHKETTLDLLYCPVLVCSVEGRYIAVHAGNNYQKDAYFAVVDSQRFHKSLLYSSSHAKFYPVMFTVGTEVIMAKLYQQSVSFSYETKKFTDRPAFLVQRQIPVSVNRVCFTSRFFYNKLYVFGGLLKGRQLETCFCYCFRKNLWERLPNLPTTMSHGGMCVSSVNTSDLSVTPVYNL